MPGRTHRFLRRQGHGGRRRHHDPEEGSFDRGGHQGHSGHHRQGHGGHHGQGYGDHHGQGGHHGHGHGRHGLHSGRKLSASDLQLILLAQIAGRPAHGYELIKSLDDHSHGLYVPSPGAIYPALTYLEEIGFASVEMDGTKKRYSLTEAGRSHYEQNRAAAARLLNDMERIGAEMAQARQAVESGLVPEAGEGGTTGAELEAARRELRSAQRKEKPYTPEEARQVAEILTRAAEEIRRTLAASEDVTL